jgi:hypothetical protein
MPKFEHPDRCFRTDQHLPNTNMCVGGASITSSPRPPPQNMCNSETWPMLPTWGPPLSLMAPCVCTCVYVCVSEAANGSMPPSGIDQQKRCSLSPPPITGTAGSRGIDRIAGGAQQQNGEANLSKLGVIFRLFLASVFMVMVRVCTLCIPNRLSSLRGPIDPVWLTSFAAERVCMSCVERVIADRASACTCVHIQTERATNSEQRDN